MTLFNDLINDGPHVRRRRRIRRGVPTYRHVHNFIHGLFWVVMISSMLAVFIVTIHHERVSYNLAVENIEKWEDNVKNYKSQVGDMTKQTEECALELYITVCEYVRATEDEALIRLCERALPETPEEFQSNLTDNMVTVLAFLERHEDLKYQVDIAQALYDLEVSQKYRDQLISSYNGAVDTYNFWVDEYEDTFTYRHFRSKRIETEMFQKYAVKSEI